MKPRLFIMSCIALVLINCKSKMVNKTIQTPNIEIYQTSAQGHKLTKVNDFLSAKQHSQITINPNKTYQTITGFGGSFTESSAYLLNRLSKENRNKILKAYFSKAGANYSLTRTHIASCDFSLNNYTYAPVKDDVTLQNFSVQEDEADLIPMIKEALKISEQGFKIIASPWTAPPWMKDNNAYVGGKLLPKHYSTFALYFSKYLEAYKNKGITIWGITPVNEPHGNGNNWESMHFSPEEETHFVQHYLGPKLETNGFANVKILGYDQNREGLKEWVDVMFKDEESSKYFAGTAIHWYESTYDYFPKALQYAHQKAPNKYLIETEGCIDSEVPKWKDDAWYWRKEATDWGFDWREPEKKYLHPKYAPANRYARDIIGCLNNWVDGWVDWNMVLDTQGGPNWFKNWCGAPILVNPETDEVYFTPLYYIMAHFSKYIRPKAKIIEATKTDDGLMVTAAQNPDGSIAVVVFNEGTDEKSFDLKINQQSKLISMPAQSLQTILIN